MVQLLTLTLTLLKKKHAINQMTWKSDDMWLKVWLFWGGWGPWRIWSPWRLPTFAWMLFSAVCHAELVVATVLANIKRSFTQLAKTEVEYPSVTSPFLFDPARTVWCLACYADVYDPSSVCRPFARISSPPSLPSLTSLSGYAENSIHLLFLLLSPSREGGRWLCVPAAAVAAAAMLLA